MSKPQFPYDEWVANALRGVLKRALIKFSEENNLGNHHLYINFKTRGKNVKIPEFLRVEYPDEITIVLQHQFKDLYLDEKGFEVTLSFNGTNEILYIPFDTVTSFADPSVNFGIQIVSELIGNIDDEKYTDFDGEKKLTKYTIKGNQSQNQRNSVIPSSNADGANFSYQEKHPENKTDGAEVINIEAFRKR